MPKGIDAIPLRVSPCEPCGENPAISFSWFRDKSRPLTVPSGEWKLCCHCSTGREDYHVLLRWFYENPEESEAWIKYLATKRWNPADSLLAAMRRVIDFDMLGRRRY
jgi:hypothetical protein